MKKIDISCYNTLVFFLIRGAFVGICSNNLYHLVGQNGWVSILISSIIGIIPLMFYFFVMKRYPNKNIFDIIKISFGKYIGSIINIVICLFTLIYASSIFYTLTEFIEIEYLYKTPNIFICIMFSICILYLIHKGIKTISKVSLIFFYIFIFLYILTFLGLFKFSDISNLLPFNEYKINTIFTGIYSVLNYNICPLFLLTFIPYNKISNDKIIKNTLTFYFLGIISILILYFLVITIYGSHFANIFLYPEFHLLKRFNIISSLERLENILSIVYIFEMVISICISLSFISSYIKNKKIILIILLNILSLNMFKSYNDSYYFFSNILLHLIFLFYFIIPFILFISKKNYTYL